MYGLKLAPKPRRSVKRERAETPAGVPALSPEIIFGEVY